MARPKSPKGHDSTSTPLADFFWIAGVDSQEILDTYIRLGNVSNRASGAHTNGVGETIQEDEDAEQEVSSILESPRPASPQSKRNSYQRLSILSDEAQMSIRSLDGSSKRSSATIRPNPLPGPRSSTLLNDADFDKALKQFASDRDSFFLDLTFSAGAVTQLARPKPRPKAQKIIVEDLPPSMSRGIGSIRRHMSFREMNSMRRQPSSVSRNMSVRTSRRASNYNSVIPVPEPLGTAPNMHPLKRKFEPVLLDRYPQRGAPDESIRRGKFPDYVPMFAFPNDVNIVSSDSRPRSTWHGFSMTAADNSRLHAICIIVWIPLSSKTAEELEKRCEEWRRANMSDAERELAASLGERLAHERADLSRLLSKLGLVQSGSAAREELDEQISAVEEKIHMMTDLLRPLRHGASSKIDGLTDGESGLWIPRAYGILGKDASLTSFWKEWLRAVVVPMSDGGLLRIPPSSPKTGMWQPLERYVINLCTEAPSPILSKTQVELTIRELRLFARKEAINELPGSRNTDLYPLFRALTIPNIVVLFEYVLAESRIILLSSHTALLYSVSNALIELIWPLKWAGIFIPILPARLIQALEAPCPYICGIERRYENVQLPDDDFVLVDLDNNEIESTASPPPMPRQPRRKLVSILQLAAPHHHKFGVPTGPPPYVVESFPGDAFSSENSSVFSPSAQSTSLSKLVGLTSTSFGAPAAADSPRRGLVLNAFLQAKNTRSRGGTGDRPRTASTSRTENTDSPPISPVSPVFPQPPLTPASRNDSGYALQASLREKRSGHFDSLSKRGESIFMHMNRKPSLLFLGHSASQSVSTTSPDLRVGTSTYAPSTYAQSTVAASTIMPGMLMQPVRNTEDQFWVEGHCLERRPYDGRCTCSVCDEKADEGFYRCSGCGTTVHSRCAHELFIVCPSAFYPEQVRAAFARCLASLFYTYRKYMQAPTTEQRKNGMIYRFNMNDFMRSLPHENADYIAVLQQTQAFNEFISERERATPVSMSTSCSTAMTPTLASITLFDNIVLSKRDRGRLRQSIPALTLSRNPFSRLSSISSAASSSSDFLSDISDHLWRTASASTASDRETYRDRSDFGQGRGRDYRSIVTRVPAKLDETLMREPRMVQGVPRITEKSRQQAHSRKPLPLPLREKLNGLQMHAPNGPPSPLLPSPQMSSPQTSSPQMSSPGLQNPQLTVPRLQSPQIPSSRFQTVQPRSDDGVAACFNARL